MGTTARESAFEELLLAVTAGAAVVGGLDAVAISASGGGGGAAVLNVTGRASEAGIDPGPGLIVKVSLGRADPVTVLEAALSSSSEMLVWAAAATTSLAVGGIDVPSRVMKLVDPSVVTSTTVTVAGTGATVAGAVEGCDPAAVTKTVSKIVDCTRTVVVDSPLSCGA